MLLFAALHVRVALTTGSPAGLSEVVLTPDGGCFFDNATGPVTYDKFGPFNVFPNDAAHPHGK